MTEWPDSVEPIQDQSQSADTAAAEPSRLALEAALAAGAWAAWLSGSGPTVAAMCAVDEAEDLAAALPADGHTKILRIDHGGAVIEAGSLV